MQILQKLRLTGAKGVARFIASGTEKSYDGKKNILHHLYEAWAMPQDNFQFVKRAEIFFKYLLPNSLLAGRQFPANSRDWLHSWRR